MKHLRTTLLAAALATLTAGPATAQDTDGWWIPRSIDRGAPSERDGDVRQRGPEARPDRDDRWTGDRPGKGNGRDKARGQGRRGDDDRDDRWGDDDRWGEARGERRRGNGPPFCRNGQGHPVHGRDWCREKGWSAGGIGGWLDGGWDDVIFRGEPRRRMEQPTLGGILGDIVFGRMVDHAERTGRTGPLDGRWLDLGERGGVLQIRAGGQPLAELADMDRDGRADVVLLSGGR